MLSRSLGVVSGRTHRGENGVELDVAQKLIFPGISYELFCKLLRRLCKRYIASGGVCSCRGIEDALDEGIREHY